ncbi:MOSC domain-containing protein [Acidimangrovimonas sediminis]|uniref:MOSC domain-containing protein n=1 Tax=Acidimangrovimonas sediminis TaxID=2056283 RepID=UPI000C807BDC|nr:MOSC N-terminal beta barrel domain-containing protein [Acidimangrovimonas sediminis]
MSATLAHIFRHPIKAHGREELASVCLSEGACLPWDRHWAVAHEAAKLPAEGGWAHCANFSRGAKAPALMAISAALDEGTGRLTLTHPDRPALEIDPDADTAAFLDWVAPLMPANRAASAAIVRAPGRGMTDSDFPSVAVLNMASNRALGAHLGQDLDLHRWRGNLWLDGLEAWVEVDWPGRTLRIGEAELKIEERITRCRATTANPATGKVDADTLGGLRAIGQGQEMGLYAIVTKGGRIARGDKVEVL